MERLFGLAASDPDEAAAFLIAVGGGVEPVASINERERDVTFFGEEIGDKKGGAGGRVRRDDFAELAGGELERRRFVGFHRDNRGTVSGRKRFAELATQIGYLKNAQNMFIRTLFLEWAMFYFFQTLSMDRNSQMVIPCVLRLRCLYDDLRDCKSRARIGWLQRNASVTILR